MVILLGEKTISNRTHILLKQTLANWPQWIINTEQQLTDPPKLIRELTGGKTNDTFLVASGDFKAVVRVNSPVGASLGIDREREAQILRLLAPSGIIPKTFYCTNDVLVSEYIEGQHPTAMALKNPSTMEAVCSALRAIQRVPMPNGVPRNYLQYCRGYLDQLTDDCVAPELRKEIEIAAKAVDIGQWHPVICHHDLVPQNIILNTDGARIIDWEYAALGHPELDFLRLYGLDYTKTNSQKGVLEPLFKVQQAMDKLWLAVQL
ncbi:phosphotransferase family protein [SAR92 clade bacterium H921]|nr:phosphotransferase family protein [SAR92 clade bacterium H921]